MTPAELAQAALQRYGAWRKAAAATGIPYATLWRMGHGRAVAPAAVRAVRRALERKPGERDVLEFWRSAVGNPQLADGQSVMIRAGDLRELIDLVDAR